MRDPLGRVPIRYKLPLTFLLVCFLVIAAGGLLVSRFARDSLQEQIENRMRAEVRAVALGVAAAHTLLGHRAEDFASDGLIREQLSRSVKGLEPNANLAQHLRINKIPLVRAFVDGWVVDCEGNLIASARPHIHNRSKRVIRDALNNPGLWFSPFSAPNEADEYPTFFMSTPIRDLASKVVLGRFIAQVHAGWFVASVKGLKHAHKSQDKRFLHLMDQAGQVLQVPDWLMVPGPRSSELIDEAAGFELHSGLQSQLARDQRRASQVMPLEESGWRAGVEMDVKTALLPLQTLESRYLSTGLIVLGVALAAILLVVSFIVLPLNRLRRAAEQIAAGGSGIRVDLNTQDEIGVVGDSFNAMVAAIEARNEKLARKKDEFAAVISAMQEGLCLLSPDGQILVSNAAAAPMKALLASDGHEGKTLRNNRCAACLKSLCSGSTQCEVEIDRRIYEVRASDLPAGGTIGGRLLVSRDITERLKMAERQAFHERMAVVGEMASVVAHEINNPLASISMFNQMMADELGPDSPFHEHVEVIQRNTATCERVIMDLLDNVRGASAETTEVDLRDVVEDSIRFLTPLAKTCDVELRSTYPLDEALVIGDEMHLRQVLMNLIMNAIQSASGKGSEVALTVVLGTSEVTVDVTDDGQGVPREIRERIFDPFFTTKGVGEGTGLGLPTARRNIEAHGGRLTLEDPSPGSTRFRLTLPLALTHKEAHIPNEIT